jgi:Cytochrome P460
MLTMRRVISVSLVLWLGASVIAAVIPEPPRADRTGGLARLEGQALLYPDGYERWPLVGASLGLSYSARAAEREGPGTFHRVYLNPASYDAFLSTRTFPERTTLVMEIYEAASSAPPLAAGYYEGQRLAVEASVKDRRFPGGWAWFDLENGEAARARPVASDGCRTCHQEHAATDKVFTQFYPKLR